MHKKDYQPERLGDVLHKSLKRLDPSGRLGEYGVWPIWNDTVGPTIAKNATPEKIRHGTLFVKVSSSTWMQQLQYMKEIISEKLNESLGKEVVRNIFFFVGKIDAQIARTKARESSARSLPPSESKLDEEELLSIKDPEIRRALKRLFAAQSRRKR